jgi:sugar lactone lactonase YvrE
VNFGSINICPGGQTTPAPCSETLALNYNVNADTTFATNPTVVTQGAPNLDFTLSSTTCTGAVTAGNSCTVNVSFAPLAPGLRMGAVQLMDNSGNLLVTTFVQGIGQGPAIAFGPGAQTTVGSGLSYPEGAAVDAAGDVFIADKANNRVVEVPAGGGAQTTVGSGLSSPTGVAVDGAGDVFISDYGNNRVVEVPADGGAQTTVGSGLNQPSGVAVDGAGDVFIADYSNNRVVEVPAGGGAQTTVGTGLSYPYGVAVDGAGDVFISDTGNNRVVEVPAGGGAQTTLGSGLYLPTGVAVDGAGDVFISDTGNNRVVEVPAGGGAQTTVGSGLSFPISVAVDGAGNVFVADNENSRVVEVQRSQPPTFSFAPTVVFNTSTDSPQSVTVQNIGNQSLAAFPPGLSIGSNSFVQDFGLSPLKDCYTGFSLTPGTSCNLSVSFIPQTTGSIVSAATFTDNALNTTPSASQSITLNGTGQAGTVNVTVGTSPAGLSFTVDSTSYSSAQSFTWTVGSLHTIATTSPQTPTAGTQYTFTSWSDGGAISHSVTASAGTMSYTASFSTSYQLTTAANPSSDGTVSPTSGGYYPSGTVVPLLATANLGYAFTRWTGSVANASNASTTVTMNAPQSVTAIFRTNPLQSIAVTPTNPSLAKGATLQFIATGTYTDASTRNITNSVTWTSSRTSVATIAATGLATAVGNGPTITIKAALGSISGSTTLTVTAPALVSIGVSPVNPTIATGGTQQFAATGTYSDSSTKNVTTSVTWTSANTSVATISSGGLATGGGTGTSQISAALGSVSGATTLTVTPTLVSIAITPANPSIKVGTKLQFTATGTYSDSSTQNLTSSVQWTLTKPGVATISMGGLATAVTTGNTTVKAKLGGVTSTTTLTVIP